MHLYVVVGGRYNTAAPALSEETFQFGLRFYANADGPEMIGTLPADDVVHPVAHTISRDETNWTIAGNWLLEMGINDLDPGDWLNDQLGPAVHALWTATVGSSIGLFTQDSFIESIKVYPIATDGHVAPAPPYGIGSPVTLTYKLQTYARGVAPAMLPPQNSIVASLRTLQNTRSGRGRIFLPAIGSGANGGHGELATDVADDVAGLVAATLESMALTGEPTGGTWATPIVAGTVPATGGERHYGPYAVINNVRVGSVVDTQRRRRRNAVETYFTQPVDSL